MKEVTLEGKRVLLIQVVLIAAILLQVPLWIQDHLAVIQTILIHQIHPTHLMDLAMGMVGVLVHQETGVHQTAEALILVVVIHLQAIKMEQSYKTEDGRRCPHCSAENTGAIAERLPTVGDVGICFYCGTVYTLNENLQPEEVTDEWIRKMWEKDRALVIAIAKRKLEIEAAYHRWRYTSAKN